ncbi:MAG: class I SAM-dependent methyltransferase [Verrucomicrobiales bacterium]
MNPLKYAKAIWLARKSERAKRAALSCDRPAGVETEDFEASLIDPTGFYIRAFQDYHRVLPVQLREHREYFKAARRGFGEDAFHTMWWHLVRRFKPADFLEIGVYRGQTLSLVALIAQIESIGCSVYGISPFSSAGDSVSRYAPEVDYFQDTLSNFRHFGLPAPSLIKAFSTDEDALALMRSRSWDCIYIDGNHDYDVVKNDWETCAAAVKPGGLIVLDDSGLSTRYQPPAFATAGHPGPSRLAREISPDHFREILQVGHNRVFQRIG